MALTRMNGLARHCALAVIALGMAVPAQADTGTMDKAEIEEIVRQYILENPEIIAEAIDRLRERERIAKEEAHNQARIALAPQIFDNPMTPVLGNPDGDVVVVEFFDYQCGYCKRTMQTVLDLQKEDPKIRVVWKELPILGPASEFASRAAMAAKKQDKYLEFHVAVMGARGQLTPESVMKHAADAGLDVDKLKRDMMAPEIGKYLRDTLQLAQQLGINGTPGFVIGGKLVPGAISMEQMKDLIAQARQAS